MNANGRLVADAIIDFAPGQTFGAFSYPDAGYGNKGIVQSDAAGGLAVESGVLSTAPSGASPGTYPKVTVDAKGRVTAAANLAAGDLPGHTHTAADIVSGELPHKGQKDGADVGTRPALNLVQGTRVSLAATDDPANDRVSVTISASPPEAGEITNALGFVPANRAGEHFTGPIDCGPHQTIGGPLENMAKHSENFAASLWDKNGGSCSVTSHAIIAPDGNQTANLITAVTTTPVIQQQISGLADGGTCTFYVWARVASGTRKVSLAIVDNPYATYLAGPTQITLTSSWQRFQRHASSAGGTITAGTGRISPWRYLHAQTGNSDPSSPMILSLSVGAQTATKRVLTLEAAKKIAAAAEAEALKNKWSVAIAIVDDGGNLIYLQRLDGTQIASIDICQFKARGAIRCKRPTKELEDRVAKGANQILGVPRMAPVEGGLPLVIGGEIVGAIGVSGVTSQQDGVVAAAGAARLIAGRT